MKIEAAEAKRRIFFANRYFHPDHSATSQLAGDLVSHLSERGWSVSVVTSRQRYDDPRANLERTELWGRVRIHRVWTSSFGRTNLLGRACDYLSFYAMASLKMIQLVPRNAIIVAKTDPPLLGVPLAIVASLKGAKLVQWLQDVFPEVAMELGVGVVAAARSILKAIRDWSLRSARTNVVLSTEMRSRVEKSGADFLICENWVTHSLEFDPAAVGRIRDAVGARADSLVVGYSGNLGRAHDWRTLLDAATLLRDELRFRFVVTGGGAGQAALQEEVEARGLRSFHFAPYQDSRSVSAHLAAADVHWFSLLPQLEGLIVPSKMYGILASARPVVYVGDIGSEIADLIRDSDCGLAIATGEYEGLAGELRALLLEPERRSRLGQNARALYDRRFARLPALARWERVLEGVAGSQTP